MSFHESQNVTSDGPIDRPADDVPVVAELVPDVEAEVVSQASSERPPWKRRFRAIGRWVVLGGLMLMTFAFLSSGLSPNPSAIPTLEIASDSTSTDHSVLIQGNSPSEAGVPAIENVALRADGVREKKPEDVLRERLAEQWRLSLDERGLEPAPMADWLTVCRRLSLALVGTGLSLEEIRSLQRIPEAERVSVHRERLLNSDRFHQYWAERTARYLVGADEGPFIFYRRRRFRTWLSEQYAKNTHYDDLVKMLIIAEGVWTDRPEVNYYTVTFDSGDDGPDPVRLAARTTRAFLGVRIDCLQCHDDFLGNVSLGNADWMVHCTDDWIPREHRASDDSLPTASDVGVLREGSQEDFHSLAAFFTAATSEGVQGLRNQKADYKYQFLYEDEEVQVEPDVPYRRDLLPPAREQKNHAQVAGDESELPHYLSDRERLAYWLTHPENKPAARAAVTRFWTLLFGQPPGIETEYGFQVGEVDNLPLDIPPSPMIQTLADAFVANDFNIRDLIRWITDSPAFQVSSQADFDVTEQHELAMAVFPVTRLRGEQVAGAAIQAGRIKTINRDSSFLVQLMRFGETNDFLKRYGDLGEDEFTQQPVTITQRLVMLNGKMVAETSKPNPVLSAASHIEMFSENDEAVVRTLYLTVLNREPSERELKHFASRLKREVREQNEPATSRNQEITDLMWVLLNSSEFGWNH
ncbi:DUF1549 domain-containing protein [Rhodopirellula halodulae]|uniref:DUF1549 domain-containing protein n=1 Tax=Rhodopirellula halodulae TaxID=2894198 RepID=UPI001E37326A|nr:DUF1549 domain-containing protein [Rhodopirellula sp. JC737]MCC9657663.1 DUF1549 and DUF1553 domain-containing protein [Rhodopirellula sp. JC737]